MINRSVYLSVRQAIQYLNGRSECWRHLLVDHITFTWVTTSFHFFLFSLLLHFDFYFQLTRIFTSLVAVPGTPEADDVKTIVYISKWRQPTNQSTNHPTNHPTNQPNSHYPFLLSSTLPSSTIDQFKECWCYCLSAQRLYSSGKRTRITGLF